MLNFVLLLLFGAIHLTKSNQCVEVYGQCGGLEYNGITQCCGSSTCQYTNLWYSQCLPSSSSSAAGCNPIWSQCGGQSWSGPTCCDNSICTYSNPYYSQCIPFSASPTSATSPSTTQSSSSTTPSTSSSSSSSSTIPSTSSSSSSSSNQGCSVVWSQCGGTGWNGPTSCCAGSICTFSNPYYSQCLPSAASSTSSSSSSSSSTASSSGSSSSTVSSTTTSSGNGDRLPGMTTRYWDCCKASCGWPGKAAVSNPVQTCAQDGVTTVDKNTQSGCTGGTAYMCNNQQPWNVSATLSYGFAAAAITGQSEANWCCACYSLIFTLGPVAGKEMIVQVTNTGGDLGNNHFDLQMPGGGVGIFDGCSRQFPGSYSWGARYGGVSQRSDCANLPAVLQAGCYWRFDWFQNADNPPISFKQVTCPSVLTAKTQCIRL